MKTPQPPNEAERLEALHQYQILDTLPETEFDDLTFLAAQICDTPISLVTFIDAERQWFKSKIGLDTPETSRDVAFCAHTILQPDLFIVPDAQQDERFALNPLVTGEPHIRFYAGASLVTPEGHALGTICVIDRAPRDLTPAQQESLRALGRQVMRQLELRRNIAQLADTMAERQRAEVALQNSEQRLHAAINEALLILWAVDPAGIFTFSEGKGLNALGLKPGEIVGRAVADVYRDVPKIIEDHHRALAGEEVTSVSEVSGMVFESRISPLCNREREVIGAIGVATDMTHRKRAEEALRQAEEKYRGIFENAVEGIYQTSPDGRIISANPALARIMGYASPEEFIAGLTDIARQIYIEPDRRAGFMRQVQEHGSVTNFESQVYREDGSVIWISENARAVRDSQGMVLHYEGFVEDVTERKNVDRMKNEFISTVSHELRTPLTSIRGALGLVASGVAGEVPAQVKAMIDIAHNNSERLVRLVNDILDIEKIEAGHMDLELQPLELMPLVEQALEDNRAYADQFGVRFVLAGQVPVASVEADADWLLQVMANLLSNAVKVSPADGTVTIDVARREAASRPVLRVAITDQGPGIAVEFRDRIFGKFAQADAGETRQKGGTGLGLSISKAIVEKLHGHIGFESHGTGTTFYFDLPEWREDSLRGSQSEAHSDGPSSGGHRRDEPAGATTRMVEHQPRILICEDDADIAVWLTTLLNHDGFYTEIAHSAEQARQLLRESHYDAMTLDLMLPDEDGILFIRELRESEKTRTLPIVVVSAEADLSQEDINSDTFRVVAWLQKPVDADHLLTTLRQATRHSIAPPRILHVDDNLDVQRVVVAILKDVAEVSGATSLPAARQKLEQESFDLVVIDPGIGGDSGLQLLPALSRRPQPIPVVIFASRKIEHGNAPRVAAELLKSRTSNQELRETITALLAASSLRSSAGDGENHNH